MDRFKEVEAARLQLQQKLDAAKSPAERNRLGQFATPAALADQIVAVALSLLDAGTPIRFLDPGFGTGSFFSSLLRQVPSERLQKTAGFEIDSHYGDEAQRLWKETPLELHQEDFTRALPPAYEGGKFNLVICNPPYVRHHHLDQAQKMYLKQAVAALGGGLSMNGLSGLYCYFLVLSQKWTMQKGAAAWLIPSEFMDVNYGIHVKRFLLEKVTLLKIHRFDPDDVQFDDALVSSAVVLFRNEPPSENHQVEFTFGGTLAHPKESARFASADLRTAAKWTGLLHRTSLRANGSATTCTLADLFVIKRGIATGCNSFFVLSPTKARELGLPERFLRPILPSPRDLDVDEIEADAEGSPSIKSPRMLIDCSLPETDLRKQSPPLWRYLETGKQAGVDQGYICSHREPWYAQEKRPAAPFLCTYMGRPTRRSATPFRFLLNHSKATAPNVYLLLYPKPMLSELLAASPGLHREIWQRLGLITGEALVSEGRIYGGGLHKLEPKELAKVPAEGLLNVLPSHFRRLRQPSLFDE